MRSISEFEGEGHFDHLFPEGRIWFSPKEAGNIIGRSDQFVRDSFYSGKIFGHVSSNRNRRASEKKNYMLVHKEAIFLFLMESANYTPRDFMETLENVIRNRSYGQLLRIELLVRELLSSKMPPKF